MNVETRLTTHFSPQCQFLRIHRIISHRAQVEHCRTGRTRKLRRKYELSIVGAVKTVSKSVCYHCLETGYVSFSRVRIITPSQAVHLRSPTSVQFIAKPLLAITFINIPLHDGT